ncbi:hypothetical protein, partial [Pseudomonas sp. GM24]|uniref:hypothetical protein n=1 Tax=Pseudomonas sp. GM24 TaxID=1144326 RepID=UPI001EE688DD
SGFEKHKNRLPFPLAPLGERAGVRGKESQARHKYCAKRHKKAPHQSLGGGLFYINTCQIKP